MDINKIFKIGLLVLGFSYLAYLFCPHTNQIGRYSRISWNGKEAFLDGATANVYYIIINKDKDEDNCWLMFNPTTGKRKKIYFNPMTK
jgi:hypothetical protein